MRACETMSIAVAIEAQCIFVWILWGSFLLVQSPQCIFSVGHHFTGFVAAQLQQRDSPTDVPITRPNTTNLYQPSQPSEWDASNFLCFVRRFLSSVNFDTRYSLLRSVSILQGCDGEHSDT